MRTTFRLANDLVAKPGGRPAGSTGWPVETTLKKLGIEALAEHADWLLLHRDRPIEFPKLEL
jgi:hypothetical protein